ncbi:MAG TPA: hypothetical protein VF525_05775 [Pyrinomonadaceae bacterium]|jgi:hypothetical protein
MNRRLVVRLIVALVTFMLGIGSTLLFNYLRPSPRVSPALHAVTFTYRLNPGPHAHAPCAHFEPTFQPAYAWTPDAPPPPLPPAPPLRPRLRQR